MLFGKGLKNSLKNSILLPWQPEFLMESNSVNIFKEDHPRNIPAKFGSNWPTGLRVDVKELWTDGRRTTTDHNISPSTSCSGELKNKEKVNEYIQIILFF